MALRTDGGSTNTYKTCMDLIGSHGAARSSLEIQRYKSEGNLDAWMNNVRYPFEVADNGPMELAKIW